MSRLIRASEELIPQWGTRTNDGRRITAEWGEPDAEGIYEPIFTVTDDGMVIIPLWRYEMLLAAVNEAVKPTGEHRLLNGYCPDCSGSCLVGFGNP